MASFPKSADVVIIGLGGIVGASVAHHLIAKGWNNIVGIDKSSVPTDIGSTSHASDFCYMTAHDNMTCYTTRYSVAFYDEMGHYSRVGGLEVARHDDDERMAELKRKVGSGKAFGTNVKMISAKEAKEKMPLLEESMIQGAMWDPDAGLVIPRSQTVAGKLVDQAVAGGALQAFQNTTATGLEIVNGRIKGVETSRGHIATDAVVVCAGLWGRLVAEMAGEDLPIMPVDHPLCFFGPYNEFEGTGKEIGYPLLRDQGNSAYLRDTGDPNTAEGGQIEWGYYEEKNPRLVHPKDLLEKGESHWSPSQRDLEMEQIIEPLERAMELTPILGELGWNDKHSFNGLLQVTADGGPSIGESPQTRGLWYAESVWVKDAPGIAKVLVDMMTDGITEVDVHGIDVARYYPMQKTPSYIYDRCYETAFKIYNPAVHNREPYSKGRNLRRSPFWSREQELGGHFMELAGWERAHGYASNEHLLEKYAKGGRAADVAKYYAMCEWFDETCGELLGHLDKQGVTDNTLILYICDNGWVAASTNADDPNQKLWKGFAQRSKGSPYENGIRTPIMVSWPGHVEPGRGQDLAHAIDLFPTIAAAAAVTAPQHLPGINLLEAESRKGRRQVFGVSHSIHNMTVGDPDDTQQYLWCVENEWKLLVRYDGKDTTRYRNVHVWDKAPVRLFNIANDPHEQKDLAAEHPEVVERIRKAITAWH